MSISPGMTVDTLGCLIVGGGFAGLTIAMYVAHFNLTVAVADAGHGRAAQIPRTRNHVGFPGDDSDDPHRGHPAVQASLLRGRL